MGGDACEEGECAEGVLLAVAPCQSLPSSVSASKGVRSHLRVSLRVLASEHVCPFSGARQMAACPSRLPTVDRRCVCSLSSASLVALRCVSHGYGFPGCALIARQSVAVPPSSDEIENGELTPRISLPRLLWRRRNRVLSSCASLRSRIERLRWCESRRVPPSCASLRPLCLVVRPSCGEDGAELVMVVEVVEVVVKKEKVVGMTRCL